MKLKHWNQLGLAFTIFAVLILSAMLLLPLFIDLNRYSSLIADEIQNAVGGSVRLGHISWGIIGNLDFSDIYVEVDEFSIEEASAFPADAQLSRAYAEVSILPLISKKIVVKTLLLESPVSILRLAPKSPEAKEEDKPPLPRYVEPGQEAPVLPVKIHIKEAMVKNGRIIVDDSIIIPGQRIVRHFSNVEVHASKLIPGKEIEIKLSLRDSSKPGLGSLAVQGTFSGLTESFTIENPTLNISATLSAIDMEAVKPYLQNATLDQRIGGNVSLSIKYKGDLGKQLRTEGTLDLSQFLYTDPSMPVKALPGAKTTLNFQGNLEADRLIVKQLNLSLGNLTIGAKAVLQNWRTEPLIKNMALTSEIPLKELEPLIPWQKLGKNADIIRHMLKEGGRISIENATLPDIDFANLPDDPLVLLPEVKLVANVSGISGKIASQLPGIHIVEGKILLKKGALTAEDVHLQMGLVTLPNLDLHVTNLLDKPKVFAQLEGSAQLGEADKPRIKALLKAYGLKNLKGRMDIALHATYDHAKPELWKADGSVLMEGIGVESQPAGVVMKNLKGHVTFNREKALKITVKEVTGRVDNAPIRIHGNVFIEDKSMLSVDANVYAKKLDLSNLGALLPDLKESELAGMVDMDLGVHYTTAKPAETRLQGKLAMSALGIRLAKKDLTFSDGNADIALLGNEIKVNHMDFRVNDQHVSLKGQMTDPKQPNLRLHLTADDLSIERLLPASKKLLTDLDRVKKASGTAELDLILHLAVARPEDFSLQGEVGLKNLNLGTTLNPASIQGLNADAFINPEMVNIATLSTNVLLPAGKNSPGGGSFSVEIHGQVNNWRKKPTLSIQHFNTSLISLASLVPAVPQEKLGAVAEQIKESLAEGGSIRIKHFTVSNIDLTHFPKESNTLLAGARAAIELKDVAVKPSLTLPKIEGITGLVGLDNGVLTAEDVHLRTGPVTLPVLDLRVTNISDKPKVIAQLEGSAQLGELDTPRVKELLKAHGLKNFTGKMYIAFHATYDHARPELWKADGTLLMDGIRVESHPAGVIMDNLKGRAAFDRKKALKITLKDVSGRINNAPIRLNGDIQADGQQKLYVDASAHVKKLDLSHIVALFPELKKSELEGMVDMDLGVHYSSAKPAETRLQGKLAMSALGIRLAKKDLTFSDGNADIKFIGNGINLNHMNFRVNNQRVSLKGQMTNLKQPNLQLHLRADDLDIDRLLPAPKKEERRPEGIFTSEQKTVSKNKEKLSQKHKADKEELPPFARNLTAKLQAEAAKGRYRRQIFQNLKLQANYTRGLLNHYDLGVEFGGGSVRTNGSVDLKNIEKIKFVINPTISKVSLESIEELIDSFEPSLKAPVSITGSLKGNTGSSPDMLASLNGNMETEIGRGRFTNVGPAGKALAKILSVVNVHGLISRRLIQDIDGRGLSFQYIKAGASFESGTMAINAFRIESAALDVNARGTVDMVNQQLNLEVDLLPLRTMTDVLHRVPLVGSTAASFTKIYTEIEGPLEDPSVRIRPFRAATRGLFRR